MDSPATSERRQDAFACCPADHFTAWRHPWKETQTIGKENDAITRPTKKIKKARTDVGVLRGRPILQDIMIGGN
jgi:hypothetical protein